MAGENRPTEETQPVGKYVTAQELERLAGGKLEFGEIVALLPEVLILILAVRDAVEAQPKPINGEGFGNIAAAVGPAAGRLVDKFIAESAD